MNKEDLLLLNNQLCFAVYACSREITNIYRPMLDELGITYPQYLVLLVLWEHQESTVKRLGELLYLDSGTLTPMLKRMETANLIKRQRSPKDERVVIAYLTEKGQTLKEKAYFVSKEIASSVGLDPEEFMSLLTKLKSMLVQMKNKQ